MRDKAVRFLRDVVEDPERADDFEAMTPEEYAEHKRVRIENPSSGRGAKTMAARILSRTELQERVTELEEENETLNEKLENILNIASGDDAEEEDEFEDED